MKTRYLDTSEIRALKKATAASDWLPFEVALYTGLRIGDVLKIKRDDISSDGILTFTAQKTGKTGQIKLPKQLTNKLTANNSSQWVFPSPRKGSAFHLTRQAAWARIKASARRANIEIDGCSPHSLRKVFAVDLFKREGSKAVMDALQHSDMNTTDIYALSDFISGENAKLPLLRGDLHFIIQFVAERVLARISKK